MTAPQLGAGAVVAGKYSIRALLGHGGAVATYHAASTTGQDVALKVYDPAVGQHANIMQAMEQAYAAVNALPPNSTAPILDAGYDQATGVPFSVVELLRMPSIAQQNRRFSADEVVTLLQGMARSLDLVHLRKVVHGALKPSNVFTGSSRPTARDRVSTADSRAALVSLDFGSLDSKAVIARAPPPSSVWVIVRSASWA